MKKKAGQPTKYKPEYCELVTKHLAQGFSLESFGPEVRVNRDTVYEWQSKYEKFSDAIKEGRDKQAKFYEAIGLGIATGNEKLKDANVTAFIWMTKNMLKWKDKQEINHLGIPVNQATVINLTLPKKNAVE